MYRTALLTLLGSLVLASGARAQVTATATPHRAGKPSVVHFDIAGGEAPISSRIPSALAMSVPRGFALDRTVARSHCTKTSAALDECPRASEIGTGALTITVFYQGHAPRDVTFHLRMYLRSRTSVLGVTFLAGTRVVPATLSSAGGVTLKFDPLPAPPVFQQVSYALKQIVLNLGITRRIVVKHRVKVHGHVRVKRTRVMHSLLTNPTSCPAGGWAASVGLTFPDDTSLQLPAPIACTP